MAVMIQSKNIINPNIRSIFSYLDRQFRNYGFDDAEEDIRMGLVSVEDELFNATNALLLLKEQYKNNQKICTSINQYLKMLAKENSNIKVN